MARAHGGRHLLPRGDGGRGGGLRRRRAGRIARRRGARRRRGWLSGGCLRGRRGRCSGGRLRGCGGRCSGGRARGRRGRRRGGPCRFRGGPYAGVAIVVLRAAGNADEARRAVARPAAPFPNVALETDATGTLVAAVRAVPWGTISSGAGRQKQCQSPRRPAQNPAYNAQCATRGIGRDASKKRGPSAGLHNVCGCGATQTTHVGAAVLCCVAVLSGPSLATTAWMVRG